MEPLKSKSLINKKLIIIFVISFILIANITLDLQASSPDHEIPVLINSRENTALSSGNTVQLMLVDQSANDQENTILASNEWQPEKQLPLETSLELDSSQIEIEKEYLLAAVIKSENHMPVLAGTMRVPGFHLIIESQVDLRLKQTAENLQLFQSEEDYLAVNFLEELAQFIYNGQSQILPQLRAASGARYGNNESTIWNKGEELMVTTEDEELTAYHKDFKDIDPVDFTFTGRGQEPGWLIELNQDKLNLEFDYAMNQLTIDRDYIQSEREDDSIIYSVMSSFLDFKIKIINQRHTDIMSGDLYLYTVELESGDNLQTGGAIRLIQVNN
ncbi:MAG: YbaY family lipoprotein [Bacillota bacterium]